MADTKVPCTGTIADTMLSAPAKNEEAQPEVPPPADASPMAHVSPMVDASTQTELLPMTELQKMLKPVSSLESKASSKGTPKATLKAMPEPVAPHQPKGSLKLETSPGKAHEPSKSKPITPAAPITTQRSGPNPNNDIESILSNVSDPNFSSTSLMPPPPLSQLKSSQEWYQSTPSSSAPVITINQLDTLTSTKSCQYPTMAEKGHPTNPSASGVPPATPALSTSPALPAPQTPQEPPRPSSAPVGGRGRGRGFRGRGNRAQRRAQKRAQWASLHPDDLENEPGAPVQVAGADRVLIKRNDDRDERRREQAKAGQKRKMDEEQSTNANKRKRLNFQSSPSDLDPGSDILDGLSVSPSPGPSIKRPSSRLSNRALDLSEPSNQDTPKNIEKEIEKKIEKCQVCTHLFDLDKIDELKCPRIWVHPGEVITKTRSKVDYFSGTNDTVTTYEYSCCGKEAGYFSAAGCTNGKHIPGAKRIYKSDLQ